MLETAFDGHVAAHLIQDISKVERQVHRLSAAQMQCMVTPVHGCGTVQKNTA